MKRVGLIGWRGMVGSVLMGRMREERDFDHIDPVFFTTSNVGGKGPSIGKDVPPLKDAKSIDELKAMDIIITCQGGDYTSEIFPKLRAAGWKGYWVDAASTLRMDKDAIIILDPVNMDVIKNGIKAGVKNYIGGNCTVSLMLIGLGGLFQKGLIEWMTSMTYQAASGAGAQNMRELIGQMGVIHASVKTKLDDPASAILDIDKTVADTIRSDSFPKQNFGVPLAGSISYSSGNAPVNAGVSTVTCSFAGNGLYAPASSNATAGGGATPRSFAAWTSTSSAGAGSSSQML